MSLWLLIKKPNTKRLKRKEYKNERISIRQTLKIWQKAQILNLRKSRNTLDSLMEKFFLAKWGMNLNCRLPMIEYHSCRAIPKWHTSATINCTLQMANIRIR